MIGLSIMAFLIIEVTVVQGNSIYFSDYARNSMHATWLAKRVMSQVEYYWRTKPFGDLDHKQELVPFSDFPEYGDGREPEYKYTVEVKEWKFPFVKLLTGAVGGGGEGEEEGGEGEEGGGGLAQMIETGIKQVFGEEPQFMTAYVEVSWAEGAQQNSTSLTYLLTNQSKIDEAITGMRETYKKLTTPAKKKGGKKKAGKRSGKTNPTPSGGSQPGGGTTPPTPPTPPAGG